MTSVVPTEAVEAELDELEGSSKNMTQVLKIAFEAMRNQMRTGMPACIERIDPTTGKADVRPCIRDRYKDGTTQKMPLITNVPVIMASAGGFAEFWPLKKDDYVWLQFGERSLDEWKAQGGADLTAQARKRRFNLSDAVAIIGPRPFNNPRTITSAGYAVGLEDNTQKLEILNGNIVLTTTTLIKLGSAAAASPVSLAPLVSSNDAALLLTLAPMIAAFNIAPAGTPMVSLGPGIVPVYVPASTAAAKVVAE